MVGTRGHRDSNGDDGKNLPTRECRKSNKNLQEPEDEIIWESDDPGPPHRRSIVTFDSSTKFPKSPVSARRDSSDKIGMDFDTDEEIFQSRRTRCSINRTSRPSSSQKKYTEETEFIMNGDDELSDKSDCEAAPRRSSRQRKSPFDTGSWLIDYTQIKGYPNMIQSSEPENEEPREAQKRHRYKHSIQKNKNPALPRRSQRSSKGKKELRRSRRYLNSNRSFSGRTKSRGVYDHSEDNEIDDEEEEEETEEEDSKVKKEKIDEELGGNKRKVGRPLKSPIKEKCSSVRTRRSQQLYIADTDNTDEEGYRRKRYIHSRTRNHRQLVHQLHDKLSESEREERNESVNLDHSLDSTKEDNNEKPKRSKLSSVQEFAMKYGSRGMHKRNRKPVSRFSYENTSAKGSSARMSSEEEDGDDESEDDNGERKYSFRQKCGKRQQNHGKENIDFEKFLKSPARKRVFSHGKKRATHSRPSSSSSSSSSDEQKFEKRKAKAMAKARNLCLPMNINPEELMTSLRERSNVGSSLADVDPMTVDRSITFDSIGGLSHHIRSLKEMIIFPFMYPEVFKKFNVSPPRGVLFYGPPGTGKTLVARALANECSDDDKKIAFFMRKGADCLSKWVGESERQLRLLFDQAYQMRPSIIFFDEIDGLAPVRSSRQDQIHSSIVSTLLALMDGLDSREEIVVIGATNRIDAIDPALRRPGRFDREFHFPLPSFKARQHILSIHTKNWEPPLKKEIINRLSERTVGYCGADIKALCSEATLFALRSQYPQIYTSKQKLLLDPSKIQIKLHHFCHSLRKIVPAAQRSVSNPGRKLCKLIQPLLKGSLDSVLKILRDVFPQSFNKFSTMKSVYRPRLLLAGQNGQGQTTHLAPAVIHALEKVPTHKLDLPSLFSVSARAPEEACAQVFHEAKRNTPCILYIPLIDNWWNSISEAVKSTLLSLLNELESSSPLLLLATSDTPYTLLDEELQIFFNEYRNELFLMSNPSEDQRQQFFRPLFYTEMLSKPKVPLIKKTEPELLPIAPPPEPRKLTVGELKRVENIEEASLRELRIFLRQICAKLARNKMFYIFTKPVDLEEVPDYTEIITSPMDLETMMTKIDHHDYECAEDFLNDVDLICSNALEYNPDRTPEDKIIRHRACTLRDTAYAYIKAEMDTDFEEKCREIRKQRKKRKYSKSAPYFLCVKPRPKEDPPTASKEQTASIEQNIDVTDPSAAPKNEDTTPSRPSSDSVKKRKFRKSIWARGLVPSKKRKLSVKLKIEDSNNDNEKASVDELNCEADKNGVESESTLCNGDISTEDNSRDSTAGTPEVDVLNNSLNITGSLSQRTASSQTDNDDSLVSSSEQGGGSNELKTELMIDRHHLDAVFNSCISATHERDVEQLHYLYTLLLRLVKKHNRSLDRNLLLQEAESEIRRFAQFQDNR